MKAYADEMYSEVCSTYYHILTLTGAQAFVVKLDPEVWKVTSRSCHHQCLLALLDIALHLRSIVNLTHDTPSESHSLINTSVPHYFTFRNASRHTTTKTLTQTSQHTTSKTLTHKARPTWSSSRNAAHPPPTRQLRLNLQRKLPKSTPRTKLRPQHHRRNKSAKQSLEPCATPIWSPSASVR
jgi:hypothetical protein